VKSAARFEETSSRVPNLVGEIVKQTQENITPATDPMGNVTGY
jgi:hypothetical protein